jgi:hypothetical protein
VPARMSIHPRRSTNLGWHASSMSNVGACLAVAGMQLHEGQ